jgi:spore germination protein
VKYFEYADGNIGNREIMFAVPSMVIGVGILTLPRHLANATTGNDGWIPIIIGGILAAVFTWIVATLASRFPKQSFYEYTSVLISKPLAVLLTLAFAFHFILFTAYEMRAVSIITKQYLLNRTPMEVIALVFLLVVIYAVSGERVGLFRLNLLFLPIILFITIVVSLMNLQLIEMKNYYPMFQTSVSEYAKGTMESFFSFAGFEILLFYIALMNKPDDAPKYSCYGIGFVVVLYLVVQFTTMGVFSHMSIEQILFPAIEMAKEIEVPGGFFERFESIYFTIWIMALFNTTALAYDVAVLALNSIFKQFTKIAIVFGIAPVIFIIGMIPQDFIGLSKFAKNISFIGVVMALIIPSILLLVAKLRGIKGNA